MYLIYRFDIDCHTCSAYTYVRKIALYASYILIRLTDPRRHSYQPQARNNVPRNQSPFQSPAGVAPAYAASAHGVAPYQPASMSSMSICRYPYILCEIAIYCIYHTYNI